MTRSPRLLALAAALSVAAAGVAGAGPTAPPRAPPAAAPQLLPGAPVIYDMETLRTGPLPAEFIKQLEPLHTLQAVEDLLKANRIAFAWGRGQVSSGTLPAAMVKEIDALPPHEVFVTPQGDKGWLVGVIVDRR
jgi:hypothetical protein